MLCLQSLNDYLQHLILAMIEICLFGSSIPICYITLTVYNKDAMLMNVWETFISPLLIQKDSNVAKVHHG